MARALKFRIVSVLSEWTKLLYFQNPEDEIEKLSKFLEVKVDKELIADIAEKCSFSRMKKEKDPMENKAEWKDGQPGMYRKGENIILTCPCDVDTPPPLYQP